MQRTGLVTMDGTHLLIPRDQEEGNNFHYIPTFLCVCLARLQGGQSSSGKCTSSIRKQWLWPSQCKGRQLNPELELCHKMVWSLHSRFYFTVLIRRLQGGHREHLRQTLHRSSFLHLLISTSLIRTTPAACIQTQTQTLGECLKPISRANADSQLNAHA